MVVARQQAVANLFRHVSPEDPDVALPVGLQPFGLERGRERCRADPHEVPLLEIKHCHARQHGLDDLFDSPKNPRQVVVVVDGKFFEPAISLENRQLPGHAAELRVRGARVDAAGEGDHPQHATGFEEFGKHEQPIQIARLRTGEPDLPTDDLLREHLHLAANQIVDAPHDVTAQRRPRIDRQHRRKVIGVDLGSALAVCRLPDLGDRQDFKTGKILGRKLEPEVEPEEINLLIVAPRGLVLKRLLDRLEAAATVWSGR